MYVYFTVTELVTSLPAKYTLSKNNVPSPGKQNPPLSAALLLGLLFNVLIQSEENNTDYQIFNLVAGLQTFKTL